MKIFRWLAENWSTLILSFLLALVVWGSAVVSANPNQESDLSIPLEIVDQPSDTTIVNTLPDTVTVTLYAPQSVIDQIEKEGNLAARLVLSGLEAGTYKVPVSVDIPEEFRPIRLLEKNPTQVQIVLDNLVEKELPITKEVVGDPAVGYEVGSVEWSAEKVIVSGRETQVQKVETVKAELDISDISESISRQIDLVPLDSEGEEVEEVNLDPESVGVKQKIILQGGYRNVAVNVVTEGKVAAGYRFTGITPNPPTVMLFSENPQRVEELPGYVNTQPLDLTGVDDYMETILELDLPEGVTVVGDPTVLVQVNVTTIKTSMTITREVEIIGLLPGLKAEISPPEVDVRLFGPVPTLDSLTLRDVRVILDLSDFEEGVHNVTPEVEILPSEVSMETLSPGTVEVTIESSNEPTPGGGE
ncbi:MAG: CdaR family protein [Chloroflexota bacterium]